jgi:uncharacterized membrane protein
MKAMSDLLLGLLLPLLAVLLPAAALIALGVRLTRARRPPREVETRAAVVESGIPAPPEATPLPPPAVGAPAQPGGVRWAQRAGMAMVLLGLGLLLKHALDRDWIGPVGLLLLGVAIAVAGAAAAWRGRRGLALLAFLGAQALYLAWFAESYAPGQVGLALGAASLIFVLATFPVLAARRPGDPARPVSIVLALGVPLAYAAEARAILWPGHPRALAVLYLILAVIHVGLGQWAAGRAGSERLATVHRAVALGLLTLCLAVRWSGPDLSLAWGIEGLALVWGGVRFGSRWMRRGGLVVLALAVGRWVMLVGEQTGAGGAFLVDSPLLAPTLVVAGACALAARLDQREAPEAGGWGALGRPLLILAALGILAGFLTAELAAFPPLRMRPGQLASLRTLVWVAATAPVLGLARTDRTRLLATAGAVAVAILAVTAATSDVLAWRAALPESWRPVLNLRFVSALMVAALYAWSVAEWPGRSPVAARRLRGLAAASVFLYVLWHASVEVGLWPLLDHSARDAAHLRNLGLSAVWMAGAIVAMAIGLWRDVAALRVTAIGLFAVTVGKVLLVDLVGLDALYRIVSFIVLGLVLLVASFLYARLTRPERA